PVFCTSAKTGVGVPEFMAAIAEDGLTAADIIHKAKTAAGEEVTLEAREDAPLVAQVFKTRIDPFVSRMSYVRLFSGKIVKEGSLHSSRSGKSLKVASLFRIQGGQQEPIDSASAGDIVALIKMEDLQVGDTLTDGK